MVLTSKIFKLSGALLLTVSLHAQWIAGYYESQNGYEPVSSIPWNKYTQVTHFAATTDGNGAVLLHWLNQAEIGEIVSAGHAAGKQVLVCIQDNGSNLNAFAQSTSPGMINTFVGNIANFVNNNGYDGVDIDWERNINSGQYTQLFQSLRTAMPGKLITTAMNNNSPSIAAAAASVPFVDQFNIMCYDMDNGTGYSWYNAALFQSGNPNVMTCDWRVNPFLMAGVPAGKIGIGIPFYGRRWQGVAQPMVNGNFPTSTVLFKDLANDPVRWQPQYANYDSQYRSNYLSIPSMNEFDTYTGAQQIMDAVNWIHAMGFGGAMTFSLHYEYLPGQGGDAQYPLSTPLCGMMFGGCASQ